MTLLCCRNIQEEDYSQLAALDLALQRALASSSEQDFDLLPQREREGRLSSSLPALQFYQRSGHSFVAHLANDEQLWGGALAQSVWQGDKPMVWLRAVVVDPQLKSEQQQQTAAQLLKAVVKSAYDSAVYEVHFAKLPLLTQAAQQEEALSLGDYAVIHLGSRAQSAR